MVYGRREYGVEETMKPTPSLKPNHVVIQVMCAGLNPVDAKDVLGDKLPHSWKKTRAFVKHRMVEGSTIGFDFSGIVVQSNENQYQVGDAVFGTMPPLCGTLSEYICAPLDQISNKPTKLSFAEAAALPLVGLTALQSLQPHIHKNSSILVLGASGGTGHVALSVARNLGATHVVGVCSPRNFDFVKEQGATHTLNYQVEDFESQVQQYCQEVLHQPTLDVIFDTVTSADPRDKRNEYPKLLSKYASTRYIRLGGETPDWFRAGCERVLPFSCFGKEKLFWIRFPKSSGELKQLQQWADAAAEGESTTTTLKPRVARVMDFTADQVQEAFDMILDRRVQGKIVVQVAKDKE
jgi:NADPH:quinone reductase-like Zn-dependent oxidoreductase